MSRGLLELEQLNSQPNLGRVYLLRALTVLLFCGLAARLWVLQVVRYWDNERRAAENRVRLEPTEAPRGGVYDRHGRLLAGSRISYRAGICQLADPSQPLIPRTGAIVKPGLGLEAAAAEAGLPRPSVATQLEHLTALLDLDDATVDRIAAELADRTRPQFQPVTVVDELTLDQRTRLEEQLWALPSVVIEPVPLRTYPAGPEAAHVIGYVGMISPGQLEARRQIQDEEIRQLTRQIAAAVREFTDEQMPELQELNERLTVLRRLRRHMAMVVGQAGLEDQYETQLQGEAGMRTWQVNARNQPTSLLSTQPGKAGSAVHLHLDLNLQEVAAEAFAGRRGSLVALDPRDGAVLAMYSSPSYDPNWFVPRIDHETWATIISDPARPLQNRAAASTYPPGSTFKLVTSAAGLAAGVMNPGVRVTCGGGMRVGGMFKRCWGNHGGGIDLTRGISYSCNSYYYSAALRMGPEPIRETALAMGCGQPTGIDLPNDQPGRVPTEAQHLALHKRKWYSGDTANIAIGQGDIRTSTLQIAMVGTVVANGGRLYRPQLVHHIESADGGGERARWQPELIREVPLPGDGYARIRHGMRTAVTSGTARVINLPNLPTAGKTGSAEDPPRRRPHAWFVCFAPYEQPEIVVAAMLENAGHGGANAGPIARDVLQAWFSRGEEEEPQ